MKSMFRTRSFDLFVNRQINNHLRQLRLIRVARAIEQRQRNDDSIYENTKNRFAYRFRRFLSHFSKNIKKRNARSIYSSSSVSFASYNSRLIKQTRTLNADKKFLQSNQKSSCRRARKKTSKRRLNVKWTQATMIR
jgi:hypothetical protein